MPLKPTEFKVMVQLSSSDLIFTLQRLSESMGIHPGDASLFINGIHVDLDIHNPFRYHPSTQFFYQLVSVCCSKLQCVIGTTNLPQHVLCVLITYCTFVNSQLLCSILDILRGEAKILEGLHNLGIRGSSISKFLHIPTSTTVEDSYALDIRHSSIMVRH